MLGPFGMSAIFSSASAVLLSTIPSHNNKCKTHNYITFYRKMSQSLCDILIQKKKDIFNPEKKMNFDVNHVYGSQVSKLKLYILGIFSCLWM